MVVGIAAFIETIHKEHPDKGYRRIRDDLDRYYGVAVNDKRVLRICRILKIKSTIKYANHGCTRQAPNPQYIAENILDRNFKAEKPNEKWLTDVTEFKWYEGIELTKEEAEAYLAELDDFELDDAMLRNVAGGQKCNSQSCPDNKSLYS